MDSSPSFWMVFSATAIELWRKPVVVVTTSTRLASAAKLENAGLAASARTNRKRRVFFIRRMRDETGAPEGIPVGCYAYPLPVGEARLRVKRWISGML